MSEWRNWFQGRVDQAYRCTVRGYFMSTVHPQSYCPAGSLSNETLCTRETNNLVSETWWWWGPVSQNRTVYFCQGNRRTWTTQKSSGNAFAAWPNPHKKKMDQQAGSRCATRWTDIFLLKIVNRVNGKKTELPFAESARASDDWSGREEDSNQLCRRRAKTEWRWLFMVFIFVFLNHHAPVRYCHQQQPTTATANNLAGTSQHDDAMMGVDRGRFVPKGENHYPPRE